LEKIEEESEFLLNYNTVLDNVYVGLEDVRLYENGGTIFYNCNRGINYNSIRVEHGQISKSAKSTKNSVLLQKSGSSDIEKNWVIIEHKDETIYCIYKWFPLTIGKIVKGNPEDEQPTLFETIREHSTPQSFKHLRGSTNGVRIGNEIWFLCHTVSYEDRRYYYHIVVVVDPHTYEIKRYTSLFTFEGSHVEYTLGFIYLDDEDHLLIGYSLYDKTAKYIQLPRTFFEQDMTVPL
jgi:hypothetical protein